jgi:hypothetical protein
VVRSVSQPYGDRDPNAFEEKIKAQANYLPIDGRIVTPFRLLFPFQPLK